MYKKYRFGNVEKQEIKKWLFEGIDKGATHCLIICDTWVLDKPEHYPLYVMQGEDVNKVASKYSDPKGIERLIEVYNLAIDIDPQIDEENTHNY